MNQDPADRLQEIDDLFEAGEIDKTDHRQILPTLFGTDVKNWYLIYQSIYSINLSFENLFQTN